MRIAIYLLAFLALVFVPGLGNKLRTVGVDEELLEKVLYPCFVSLGKFIKCLNATQNHLVAANRRARLTIVAQFSFRRCCCACRSFTAPVTDRERWALL